MDNMNNENITNIQPENGTYFQDFEAPALPKEAYPPKRNRFIEILIAFAKCVGYLFVWLGIQYILVQGIAIVLMAQNPTMNQDELMKLCEQTVLKYSILLTVVCNLLALGIYFLIFYIARKSLLKKVSISLPDSKAYLPTLALGFTGQLVTSIVLGILMNVLNVFPQKWVDDLNQTSNLVEDANSLLSFFAVVILAPVFEEILCRGLILKTLNKTMNKWCAIVLSAAIFGIIHGNPIQFIYATALGILLGWIYTKFDSIWVPMLCHLGFNLVSQLAGLLDPENVVTNALLTLVSFASIPAFILLIIYFNMKAFKKNDDAVKPDLVPYDYSSANMNLSQNGSCTNAFESKSYKEYNEDIVNRLINDIENNNDEE